MKPEAANRFREGWIMLLRPFEFGELAFPLQKFTVLYAYSEEPEYETVPHPEYIKLQRQFLDGDGRYPLESIEQYNERGLRTLEIAATSHKPSKLYKGETVQVSLKTTVARFYSDEYSIVKDKNLEIYLEDDAYTVELLYPEMLKLDHVKNIIFYAQSRGISKVSAIKIATLSLKQAVYLKPRRELLEMFCRFHEIIPETKEEREEYAKNLEFSRPPLIQLK